MTRLFLIVTLVLPLALSAQKSDIKPFQLGEDDLRIDTASRSTEIISASRSVKKVEDLPVTVYVINRHEILENGYITLVDVLKDVPGFKVSQPGSGMEGETFLMNGLFGNYYCKILVNGMPITPSVTSGTPISGNLPVRQAERIEIISGPSAALYGSDALAGVINIITRDSERPIWAQTDLSVGSQGFYSMNVMIGGKFGKNKNVAEYSLYGNYGQSGDMNVKYDVPGNYDPSLYSDDFEMQPYYRGTSTSPEFDRLPKSSSLLGFGIKYRGISANYDHMERRSHSSIGRNTGQYAYYDPNSYWGESIDRVSLGYAKTWNRFSSSTLLSVLVYRLDNNTNFHMITERGDNGKVYKYSASDDIFLDEVLTYSVKKNLEISGGFSMQASGNLPLTNDLSSPFDKDKYSFFSEQVDFSDTLLGDFGINPRNFYNLAGYLQLFYTLGKFSLLAGTRWDQHSIFGSNLSPKAGLIYRLNESLSFRVNYGHGYRVPSLYYLYRSLAYPGVANGIEGIFYEIVPNTEVNPERFRAAEFGIRYKPHPKISTEFIFMYHKLIENLTLSLVFLDSLNYPGTLNIAAQSIKNDLGSNAELYLAQINIRVKDIVPSIKLSSDLYITLSKGKEVLPNEFGELDDYRNMPNWFVQWNVNMDPARKWTLILHNVVSGSWKKRFFPVPIDALEAAGLPSTTKGYYTLDLVNRFSINRNFHAFLIINNLFNAHYGGIDAYGSLGDLVYNPQYERHFRLGFSFTMD